MAIGYREFTIPNRRRAGVASKGTTIYAPSFGPSPVLTGR